MRLVLCAAAGGHPPQRLSSCSRAFKELTSLIALTASTSFTAAPPSRGVLW
jgi:hypothetical protein